MNKRDYLFMLITAAVLCAAGAHAQEVDPEVREEIPVVFPVSEETPGPNETGSTDSKSSLYVIRPETSTKSTSASGAGPAKLKNEKQAGKEEDDALSFNFLFYIIQKFKISDLKNN